MPKTNNFGNKVNFLFVRAIFIQNTSNPENPDSDD